jgi:hypothetical protein
MKNCTAYWRACFLTFQYEQFPVECTYAMKMKMEIHFPPSSIMKKPSTLKNSFIIKYVDSLWICDY